MAIGIKTMSGTLKRMFAGMQIFTTEAHGPGQIAFSRDAAGARPSPCICAAARRCTCASTSSSPPPAISTTRSSAVRGVSNLLLGGSGFFIDKFNGTHGDGIVWLHGYGNVFEKVLGPGEEIDVEPGAWLYKDPGVKMTTNIQRLSTGLFAGNEPGHEPLHRSRPPRACKPCTSASNRQTPERPPDAAIVPILLAAPGPLC